MTQISGEANDTLQAVIMAEEARKERTRQRHSRESAARAAALMGSNREGVRKAKKLQRLAPDLAEQVSAGAISLDAAYRQAVGDTRVALHLRMDADTADQLRDAAADLDMSPQQLVADLIFRFLLENQQSGWVL